MATNGGFIIVEQILHIQHTRTLYLASDSKYGIYYISKKNSENGWVVHLYSNHK